MITVYGRKSSANVQKVRWICSEGNLEFKTEIVGGKYGGLTSPEFISLNPNSTIPVLKDGVLSEVKARPAIEKVKKPTDFKYNKVSGRKASAKLRKARERIDEDAMRDAEDELGVYNPNKHVQILEENKRAIADLENQIESMNRRDGNRAWSLGHIISLENGGLHIRENMIIEPGRSRDGRRGNSSRSHLTDISKEKAEEMGIPTTYKAWITQKYFPGARNISKELGDDGMLKVMDGAEWQSVLDERAANGTTI